MTVSSTQALTTPTPNGVSCVPQPHRATMIEPRAPVGLQPHPHLEDSSVYRQNWPTTYLGGGLGLSYRDLLVEICRRGSCRCGINPPQSLRNNSKQNALSLFGNRKYPYHKPRIRGHPMPLLGGPKKKCKSFVANSSKHLRRTFAMASESVAG